MKEEDTIDQMLGGRIPPGARLPNAHLPGYQPPGSPGSSHTPTTSSGGSTNGGDGGGPPEPDPIAGDDSTSEGSDPLGSLSHQKIVL